MTSQAYDTFDGPGPGLDPNRWTPAAYPLGDTVVECEEPNAKTSVGGGTLEIRVERFERSLDLVLDNAKHLIVSTTAFPIAAEGDVTFSVEMAAENIGDDEYSFRHAFASFNVVDITTGSVFDHLTTSRETRVAYERLFIPGIIEPADPFTWLIERPFLGLDFTDFHEYAIVFNRQRGHVDWFVDGTPVFSAREVTVPESSGIAFGLMTLMPIVDGKSTSLRGQGMAARWRRLQVPA
jgi:hypothetical protein